VLAGQHRVEGIKSPIGLAPASSGREERIEGVATEDAETAGVHNRQLLNLLARMQNSDRTLKRSAAKERFPPFLPDLAAGALDQEWPLAGIRN
jgi:hypothetical protein